MIFITPAWASLGLEKVSETESETFSSGYSLCDCWIKLATYIWRRYSIKGEKETNTQKHLVVVNVSQKVQ